MMEKIVNSSGLMCGLSVGKKRRKMCLLVTIGIKKKCFRWNRILLRTDDQSPFWFLSFLLLLFFFPMWDRDVKASPLILSYSLFADTSQIIF